jgi:predicted RNA-binding protein with PIN domain
MIGIKKEVIRLKEKMRLDNADATLVDSILKLIKYESTNK